MSNAWEVTTEDVINALNVNGVDDSQFYDMDEWDEFVDKALSEVDVHKVEKCAMRGVGIDEQTDLALEEIEEQLRNAKLF